MWWLGLFFLLLLSACLPAEPLPTRAVLAATPLLTSTRTAVLTQTLPPTIIPIPSPTPLSTPTPCAGNGRIESGTFPSPITGTTNYQIYLPPCYGMDGRVYPTLYLLPGNGQDERIWDNLGMDEAAEQTILTAQIPPLIIVMPDGGWLARNSSGGPGSYESLILNHLIPFIETNTCAWAAAEGRAIGGLSRGGYWALEIAFRYPDRFASVGGHSAALLDIAAGPALNPQDTALNNDLGSLRIYFDIGESDAAIANIRRLHENMTGLGIAHEWTLNPGGHNIDYWSAHAKEYLLWYAAPWPARRSRYPFCPITP